MALNICAELFYRVFFEFLLFFKESWFAVILTALIIYFITKKVGPLVIALIADGLNIASDTSLGATFGASIFLSMIIGIAIGLLWASIIFFSAAPMPLQIINILFMFLIGLIWGVAILPIPITLILGISMRWRITNYLIGIIPALLVIGFIMFAGNSMCSLVNSAVIFLS